MTTARHNFDTWLLDLLKDYRAARWWEIHRAYRADGFPSNYSTFPKRLTLRVLKGVIACVLAKPPPDAPADRFITDDQGRRLLASGTNATNWYFDPCPLFAAGFILHNEVDRKIAADWLEENGCETF